MGRGYQEDRKVEKKREKSNPPGLTMAATIRQYLLAHLDDLSEQELKALGTEIERRYMKRVALKGPIALDKFLQTFDIKVLGRDFSGATA